MRWCYICLFIFLLFFSTSHITTVLLSMWNHGMPQERLQYSQNWLNTRNFWSAPIWRRQWHRQYSIIMIVNTRSTTQDPSSVPFHEHARSWPSQDVRDNGQLTKFSLTLQHNHNPVHHPELTPEAGSTCHKISHPSPTNNLLEASKKSLNYSVMNRSQGQFSMDKIPRNQPDFQQ